MDSLVEVAYIIAYPTPSKREYHAKITVKIAQVMSSIRRGFRLTLRTR